MPFGVFQQPLQPAQPMTLHLIVSVLTVALFGGVLPCRSQEAKTADSTDLAAAQTMLQSGNVSGALQKYQQILKSDSTLIPAQAGLIRPTCARSRLILPMSWPRVLLRHSQIRLCFWRHWEVCSIDAVKFRNRRPHLSVQRRSIPTWWKLIWNWPGFTGPHRFTGVRTT